MNRTILIIGAIVVVAVGGGVAWFTLGRNNESASRQTNNSSTTQTGQTNSGQTNTGSSQAMSHRTMNELRLEAENRKCTFTSTLEDGSQSNGTIYIDADKRMRGDFDLTKDGENTKSSMIIRDDTQYLWQQSSKQGVKMAISEILNQNNQNPNQSATEGTDTNTPVDFTCSAWRVDDAMFTPPADVTFSDMTSVMQQSTPR